MSGTIGSTIVNVALIALLVAISYFHIARGLEYFQDFQGTPFVSGDMRSRPAPLFDETPSVFSSLPPQSQHNAAWRYLAPYQSACLAPDRRRAGGTGGKGSQCITCSITPHNQRYCQWS